MERMGLLRLIEMTISCDPIKRSGGEKRSAEILISCKIDARNVHFSSFTQCYPSHPAYSQQGLLRLIEMTISCDPIKRSGGEKRSAEILFILFRKIEAMGSSERFC